MDGQESWTRSNICAQTLPWVSSCAVGFERVESYASGPHVHGGVANAPPSSHWLIGKRKVPQMQLSLFGMDILADTGRKRGGYRFRSYRVYSWDGRFLGISWVRQEAKNAAR